MEEKSWVQKQANIILHECDKIWAYLKDNGERMDFLNELSLTIDSWIETKDEEILNEFTLD